MQTRAARVPFARPTVITCGLVATLCVLSMGGCYQRVVRAKGLGADNYNVSEPYQESGKLDEWIFGTPGPSGKRANNTKLPPAQ